MLPDNVGRAVLALDVRAGEILSHDAQEEKLQTAEEQEVTRRGE